MEPELDDTDVEILRLLVEDGRRPYTEIADEVGMSPPSVIDRVDRLRESGVIQGFEARLDRPALSEGRLLVRVKVGADAVSGSVERVLTDDRVETAYASADGTVTLVADALPSDAGELVGILDDRGGHEVEVIVDEGRNPRVARPSFTPDCAECGNTVDEEGVSARIAGDVYHFCCTSCESAFTDRYSELG